MDTLMKLKSLNKQKTSQIIELTRGYTLSNDLVTKLKILHITKSNNINKYNELLDQIEREYLKNNNINFIMKNIPSHSKTMDSDLIEKVGNIHIKETLEFFGEILLVQLIQGNAYIKFREIESAKVAHDKLNNMQINQNIITTQVMV